MQQYKFDIIIKGEIMKTFMDIALNEARKAYKLKEVPVGAVIECDGKIIAKAHNLRHTKKVSTYHAEILAIEKACKKLNCWQLDNCNMYVTLEPCVMCAGAIINARIKNVFYGTPDLNNGAYSVFNCQNLKNSFKVNAVLESNEECSQILKRFFKELRDGKHSSDNC